MSVVEAQHGRKWKLERTKELNFGFVDFKDNFEDVDDVRVHVGDLVIWKNNGNQDELVCTVLQIFEDEYVKEPPKRRGRVYAGIFCDYRYRFKLRLQLRSGVQTFMAFGYNIRKPTTPLTLDSSARNNRYLIVT